MVQTKLGFVYLSLLLAFISLLLPWSGIGLTLRPDFTLLVLIFWILRAPQMCNIGTAWLIGLLVDLAVGGIFGQYALAYTITAFFAITYQRRLVLFNSMQQLIYVLVLLLIAQCVLLILKTFVGIAGIGWGYFLPSITGALLWQIAVKLGLNTGRYADGK